MAIDRRRSLSKKGFRKEETGHHIYFHHEYKGKETGAYTFFPHSKKAKDIDRNLWPRIRKQLKLDKNSEAIDLLTCPMDGQQYNKILIKKLWETVKAELTAVEIIVTESMLREVNPVIPADVRKFFPREGGAFKLHVPEGYTIDAYMGNRGARDHIHSHGEKRFRIQEWWRQNMPQDDDVLRFEKIDEEHYRLSLLKTN